MKKEPMSNLVNRIGATFMILAAFFAANFARADAARAPYAIKVVYGSNMSNFGGVWVNFNGSEPILSNFFGSIICNNGGGSFGVDKPGKGLIGRFSISGAAECTELQKLSLLANEAAMFFIYVDLATSRVLGFKLKGRTFQFK